jgi:signal transduction histidine kinase
VNVELVNRSNEPNQVESRAASRPSASCEHLVQFYQSEDFLRDVVTRFLGDGLHAGEPCVVIAGRSRLNRFARGLQANGFDVPEARRDGRLKLLEARETLATFMDGTLPNERRFRQSVGSLIEETLREKRGSARAYGEMVDLLWKDGNHRGALRLEELWNDLAKQHSFSLLCAYSMANFYRESHGKKFREVCSCHGRVLPSDSFDPTAKDEDQFLQIALLQQRAQSLEHEIEKRRELEEALRGALAERRRTEALLRQAQQEADRANRAKSDFLAVMSHELRTPLNAIIGYKDLMDQGLGGPLTDAQRGYLGRIEIASSQLLRLVDQILNLARIEAGKEELTLEAYDLCAGVSEASALIEPAATAKGLTLRSLVPMQAITCVTDAGKVRQILLNLLSNAVKFTERGHVQVACRTEDGWVEASVIDTGPGIHEEDLGSVFEPFVRGRQRGAARGTGLGLPVSRQLARLLGGEVSVASTVGQGSTFTLRLPIAPARKARDASDTPHRETHA